MHSTCPREPSCSYLLLMKTALRVNLVLNRWNSVESRAATKLSFLSVWFGSRRDDAIRCHFKSLFRPGHARSAQPNGNVTWPVFLSDYGFMDNHSL
jgi:hypothetical protein